MRRLETITRVCSIDPNTQPCNLALSLPTWYREEDGRELPGPTSFFHGHSSGAVSALAPSLAHLKHRGQYPRLTGRCQTPDRRQRGPNPFKCLDKLVASAAQGELYDVPMYYLGKGGGRVGYPEFISLIQVYTSSHPAPCVSCLRHVLHIATL